MASTQTPIATDSAAELNEIIGNDATATFENDPKFIDSDPSATASSENIAVQRATDDTDSEEEEDELEDEEDDDELEDEDLEDEEDDEDEDDVDLGDEEDEEEEDDENEAGVAA